MKDKHVRRYMRTAKQFGEDQNPCYSRQIGAIIVDPQTTVVLGIGYNGPPRGVPHCDDWNYLETVFWPQLTDDEKLKAATDCGWQSSYPDGKRKPLPVTEIVDHDMCRSVVAKYANSKICPRRIVGAASGKRLELCGCAHAEANAITNSHGRLIGSYLFTWSPIPCFECSKIICNKQIAKVYCYESDDNTYSTVGSRYNFLHAGIEVIEKPKDWYLE